MVDLGLVKSSIFTFVEMGFIQGDIIKEFDEFIWKGDKNNEQQYNAHFAKQLLERVRNFKPLNSFRPKSTTTARHKAG